MENDFTKKVVLLIKNSNMLIVFHSNDSFNGF